MSAPTEHDAATDRVSKDHDAIKQNQNELGAGDNVDREQAYPEVIEVQQE